MIAHPLSPEHLRGRCGSSPSPPTICHQDGQALCRWEGLAVEAAWPLCCALCAVLPVEQLRLVGWDLAIPGILLCAHGQRHEAQIHGTDSGAQHPARLPCGCSCAQPRRVGDVPSACTSHHQAPPRAFLLVGLGTNQLRWHPPRPAPLWGIGTV